MSNIKMNNKPKSNIASKIPTSGRDSGTHSRSSSVSNLTTASDLHSETGDTASVNFQDFKIDERVWVNGTKPGYIKFIGKTQFAPGVWAGVLLDDAVGKNDGSVDGVKYFSCEPLRGIFSRPSKLTRTAGVGNLSLVGTVTTPLKSNVSSSRASVCSNASSPSPRCSKLKVGDRITVSSLSGLKSGTLRFIGETDFAKGEWAGIELDEPTGKNDGTVAGKRYFTCELKYGLFAPLHKVSRPGATPVSRPGSVRGSSLMRSSSRDSINSSVSTCSRASRVKLGITSLTSAQKAKVVGGLGASSTTKAFEEAIKEKDQHIEQLLKERELDRAEFARLANHFEQIGVKSSELEKKCKIEESEKKTFEEQLLTVQKKVEDIQFQLEEERIAKTDFEAQLLQKNKILKNIEEYISKGSGEKNFNIKEILSGHEVKLVNVKCPSEISDTSLVSGDSGQLENNVTELKATINSLSKEKQEISCQLTELQKHSKEKFSENQSLITNLNSIIQEKDDMITTLKNELNKNIEKVTELIEENKNLNEQIILKEKQAKGHADDVIKELGEKVSTLHEELKTQSSQLAEHITALEEKDSKIATLEHSFKDQADALSQLRNQHKSVSDTLKIKETQCEEFVTSQKSLEEVVNALKSQLETDNGENQKKINLLEEEIKTKSGLLTNYLSSIEEKENLISSLQQNFNSQAEALLQLQNEKKELTDCLNQKESQLSENAANLKSLEDKIICLTAQNESSVSEKEKKILDLVKQIESQTNCMQEKEDQIFKTQSDLNTSQSTIQKLNETLEQLSERIQQADLNLATATKDSAERINSLQNELNILEQQKSCLKSEYEKEISSLCNAVKMKEEELQAKSEIFMQHESQITLLTDNLKKSADECIDLKNKIELLLEKNRYVDIEKENLQALLKTKDEEIADLTKQLKNIQGKLDKSSLEFENNAEQLQLLQTSLDLKEEENNQLISKLQLADQKVEVLNKDSSDHVMTLQNELSKIKEESITIKTHLEQELSKIKNEKEKLNDVIQEKEASLFEKEGIITSLENNLKEKDSEISELSSQNKDILQNISKCNADIEVAKKQEEKLFITISECELKLAATDQEFLNVKNDNEKLSCALNEKEKSLLQKEDIIANLQTKLKDKEIEVSQLSSQIADLSKNIAKFSSEIEEGQKLYVEKLSNSTSEFDFKLKEKDEIIQNIQIELNKYKEELENETKERGKKEDEINSLKKAIQELESQFNELTKIIESSQNQLTFVKEQNETNESLLKSKEAFISDFKIDQERKLQEKTQIFREEISKLENLINSKNEEINSKEAHTSSLLNKVQDMEKIIDSLQVELGTIKTDKKKLSDESNNVCHELNNKINEMEEKYSKLLEEKEKIAKEELHAKEAKKNLEQVKEMLLQEKSAQEIMVKDKEAKLETLQAEVNRMQTEFALHKQELQSKLDVSKLELQAASELKNELVIQHNALEELQQELHNSEKKCKELEALVKIVPIITQEKNQLNSQIDELQKMCQEKSEMAARMLEKNLIFEDQLINNKCLILQKENELASLKEQLKNKPSDKVSPDLSLKTLEEENLTLKKKIEFLESEKKPSNSSKIPTKALSSEEAEEKESLISQVEFLNSIIVDLKQKNEKIKEQLEAQTTCWDESDINLNETKKVIPPRLFCDICEIFDLHETDDCPKQESFADEEVPQLRHAGTRQLEERPYCNNCEVFGHWTLDCEEPETF